MKQILLSLLYVFFLSDRNVIRRKEIIHVRSCIVVCLSQFLGSSLKLVVIVPSSTHKSLKQIYKCRCMRTYSFLCLLFACTRVILYAGFVPTVQQVLPRIRIFLLYESQSVIQPFNNGIFFILVADNSACRETNSGCMELTLFFSLDTEVGHWVVLQSSLLNVNDNVSSVQDVVWHPGPSLVPR